MYCKSWEELLLRRRINRELRRKWTWNRECTLNSSGVVSWGEVRLSPLSIMATLWPIVPPLDDGWRWVFSNWWNDWQVKPKYSEKTCPSAALPTTSPTWLDLGCCSGKSASNCISYGMTWTSQGVFIHMFCILLCMSLLCKFVHWSRQFYTYRN
jgi:hypothetical protein